MTNTWDRQADEPEEAWALFREWRDHELPRPTPAAYCRERGRGASTWPRQYGWDGRGLAWDQYVDAHRQEATVSQVAEMARRHISIAQDLLDVVQKSVSLTRERVERLIPLTPNEMSRMVEVATKLERLSRGEATERSEGAGPNYTVLSDEELETLEGLANKATQH